MLSIMVLLFVFLMLAYGCREEISEELTEEEEEQNAKSV